MEKIAASRNEKQTDTAWKYVASVTALTLILGFVFYAASSAWAGLAGPVSIAACFVSALIVAAGLSIIRRVRDFFSAIAQILNYWS